MNVEKLFFRCGALAVLAILLSGCATTSKTASTSGSAAEEPKPLQLAPLPEYGPEKTGYDTSAACYLSGSSGMDDAVTHALDQALSGALVKRGYKVVSLASGNTAEVRSVTDKIIRFDLYSCRSLYLPVRGKFAADIGLIVGVMDRPERVPEGKLNVNYFHVFGRDIADLLEAEFQGLTTSAAIQNAVDNLFTIDGFRKALEVEQKTIAGR